MPTVKQDYWYDPKLMPDENRFLVYSVLGQPDRNGYPEQFVEKVADLLEREKENGREWSDVLYECNLPVASNEANENPDAYPLALSAVLEWGVWHLLEQVEKYLKGDESLLPELLKSVEPGPPLNPEKRDRVLLSECNLASLVQLVNLET